MMHFARLLSLAVAPSTTAFRTRRLGSSQLVVTEACLGTMTWGVQNTEAEAHEQLDFALKERGVTMVDTAELYPVPLTAPMVGRLARRDAPPTYPAHMYT